MHACMCWDWWWYLGVCTQRPVTWNLAKLWRRTLWFRRNHSQAIQQRPDRNPMGSEPISIQGKRTSSWRRLRPLLKLTLITIRMGYVRYGPIVQCMFKQLNSSSFKIYYYRICRIQTWLIPQDIFLARYVYIVIIIGTLGVIGILWILNSIASYSWKNSKSMT